MAGHPGRQKGNLCRKVVATWKQQQQEGKLIVLLKIFVSRPQENMSYKLKFFDLAEY